MNSKTICFTLLVVFSLFSGSMYITNQNLDAFEEINKPIFKNSHFEMEDNSFVSYAYDTINQDNNYNHIEYSSEPSILNINPNNAESSFGYPQYRTNYLNGYSYNNHYDYRNEFVAPLDPYPVISDSGYYYLDSHGIVYLSFDYSFSALSYKVFVEGMSYLDGDDVEIIEIHLGTYGQNGPSILSFCNEKIKEGHCREGPGLSVEGVIEEKDLTGPLKGSSFSELIEFFKSGQSYVYVQSRDHPDGEMRGQIHYY
jgi:hypothetical protein